jgi:hypothetical protein
MFVCLAAKGNEVKHGMSFISEYTTEPLPVSLICVILPQAAEVFVHE